MRLENEKLRVMNEQLNSKVSKLEEKVNRLEAKLALTEQYAILRQFAINVEYELKDMMLRHLGKPGTEYEITNTDINSIKIPPNELSSALKGWFGESSNIQSEFETLKESLRWMKSYFHTSAHPVQFGKHIPILFLME